MPKPINILLTNSSHIYGGGEFYVLEVAKELTKRGHNIIVCCKPDNLLLEKCSVAGVKTIPLDFPPMGQLLKYIRNLKSFIEEHHIQIVHTNTNYDRTAGAFAARWAGAKHITNVHSSHSLQHNLTHLIRNQYCTDRFIVDGVCVQKLLEREDKISPEKISVVYLGVDPESMKRNELLRSSVRREFDIEEHHTVIGNVGRLVPMKGQIYLLDAFGLIAGQYPDARLLLVGDGELLEQLKLKSEALNIKEKIIFAGFRDDLVAMYSAFDIYAHPSIEGGGETFPFAVLQALSQELPVVVTRVGDVAAMVEEGVNGFVVEEKQPGILAEKISFLMNNVELKTQMAKQSRELLLKKFTTNIMVDNLLTIYYDMSATK